MEAAAVVSYHRWITRHTMSQCRCQDSTMQYLLLGECDGERNGYRPGKAVGELLSVTTSVPENAASLIFGQLFVVTENFKVKFHSKQLEQIECQLPLSFPKRTSQGNIFNFSDRCLSKQVPEGTHLHYLQHSILREFIWKYNTTFPFIPTACNSQRTKEEPRCTGYSIAWG
eukprot:3779784-Amphidinium_carterae.1